MKLFFVLSLALVLVFSVMVSIEASPTPSGLPAGGDEKIKKILMACATENMAKVMEAKQKGGGEDEVKNIVLSCLVEKIEKASAEKCASPPGK